MQARNQNTGLIDSSLSNAGCGAESLSASHRVRVRVQGAGRENAYCKQNHPRRHNRNGDGGEWKTVYGTSDGVLTLLRDFLRRSEVCLARVGKLGLSRDSAQVPRVALEPAHHPRLTERTGMSEANHEAHAIRQIIRHARRHPARWLVPSLLIGALSVGYAAWHHPDWEASQALTVREQHADGSDRSGQLSDAELLKHAQETFLELARSPAVLTAALRAVGPPPGRPAPQNWPTAQDVDDMRKNTEVTAPNGLEFGTTRMFYLNVTHPDPQRAVALASAICDASEQHFRTLRDSELRDAIAQLTNTVTLASQELDQQTEQLRQMEVAVGSDLAELRMLSEPYAGTSNLQTTLSELRQELRHTESESASNEQLLKLLNAAQRDPATLVATPNQLLEAQPALRRLKDGLIDAQLKTSELMGTMSADHPRVQAALVAEEEIRGHLHRELDVALRGLRGEQEVLEARTASLNHQVHDLQSRLERLAGMRTAYTKQLAEVQQQTDTLTQAQKELNATRANLAAGDVVGLVTRIDMPRTGPYPQGPGRSVIAAGGIAGGWLVGFGILVLTLPSSTASLQVEPPKNQLAAEAEPVAMEVPEPITDTSPDPVPLPPSTPSSAPPFTLPASSFVTSSVLPESGTRRMTLKQALLHCASADRES